MKITLISHASVIIESQGRGIWTDPWLTGKVFNQSWSLLPAAAFDPAMLDGVDFLWISHLHPDHFHIPSLAALPDSFKRRVRVLYQDNNPQKVFEPLRQAGYEHFEVMRHRVKVPISENGVIYCYRVGTLDSCLGVREPDSALVNINDARVNSTDCQRIRTDLRSVDVVLNQFSLAVYNGFEQRESYLRRGAAAVLYKLFENHRDLAARRTIPFASFMYFSAADNRYMNAFANRPASVWNYGRAMDIETAILYPGDTYQTSRPHDSAPALARYAALYQEIERLPYDTPPLVTLARIREAFHFMARQLRERYPRLMLALLRPLTVYIPDLDKTVSLSFSTARFVDLDRPGTPDLVLRSQALHFCFSHPYGLQTLSSSAQHAVLRHPGNWRMHRAMFALNNAEIYGRARYLFSRRTLGYVLDRLRSAARYNDLSVVGAPQITAGFEVRSSHLDHLTGTMDR